MVMDNYVKEEEGTGVVHQAPYFGAVSIVFKWDRNDTNFFFVSHTFGGSKFEIKHSLTVYLFMKTPSSAL